MVEQNAVAAMKVADSVAVLNLGELQFSGSVEAARDDETVLLAFLGEAALLDQPQ